MKKITLTLLCLFCMAAGALFSCSSSGALTKGTTEEPVETPKEEDRPAEKLTAVFLADTQIGYYDSNNSYTQDSLNFELAVNKINQICPDFVVVNGDMINTSSSAKQLACFWSVMKKVNSDIPVWYVPGNHDIGSGSKDAKIESYINEFGYDRFTFTKGQNTFIGINSCIIKDERAELAEEQLRWLKRALRESMKKQHKTYIICHHPFFIKSYGEKVTYSNQSQEIRDQYWSIFKEFGVTAVFAGHVHNDAVSTYNGIGMITVGPVTKALGDGTSGFAVCDFEHEGYKYEYIPFK